MNPVFFFQMVKSFKSKSRYSKYISIHTRRIVGDVFVVVGDLLHFSKFLGFRSSHWPLGIFERRTHINYHNDLEMKLWLRFNETHYPHTQFVLIDCCQEVSCSAPFDDYVHLTWTIHRPQTKESLFHETSPAAFLNYQEEAPKVRNAAETGWMVEWLYFPVGVFVTGLTGCGKKKMFHGFIIFV